ncbi:MAG: hypothetical protein ACRDJE_26870, partial [Dehalococcoidia bacterium]
AQPLRAVAFCHPAADDITGGRARQSTRRADSMSLLILALVVGAVLPIVVAAVTIFLGVPRQPRSNWGLVSAFAKGIALGIVIGLTVSGLVIGLVLGIAWLLDQ